MIEVTIPSQDCFDVERNAFQHVKECTLRLEHSLVAVSRWESKWHKVFLDEKQKTNEEMLDYIRCMALEPPEDDMVFHCLTRTDISRINDYIADSMSATFFREEKQRRRGREPVTSELIYYWLVALQIPFECQYWHLNRLLTLVRICNLKNQPKKKQSQFETMTSNAALNKARREMTGSKG